MDALHFDTLTRTVSTLRSRRAFAGALGLGALALPAMVDAKKKRRKKEKKIKRNVFGCVDVGGKCRGNDANCCSSICEGKKPKKGKKDKSVCVAHNSGTCQAGEDTCLGNGVFCGEGAVCARTTGNAPFCAKQGIGACRECAKDVECQALLGPGAACVVCAVECMETITLCIAAGA